MSRSRIDVISDESGIFCVNARQGTGAVTVAMVAVPHLVTETCPTAAHVAKATKVGNLESRHLTGYLPQLGGQ
jgi:hypothetical protein